MAETGAVLDTDAVINGARVSRLQIVVGVLGALILLVDGFNTQVIGYIAPRIARDMHLSHDVLAWVLSADKVGLLIGYLFVAPLSGYFGHKRVSIACILGFGAMGWITTISGTAPELFIFRLLTGIGLGGALPSGVALTGEYFPKARRSTAVTFIYCGLSLGQLSAGEVANATLQPFGWQGALWAGGALALLLAVTLAALMPESLEYLVNRSGRPQQAARILARIDRGLTIPPGTTLVAGERNGDRLTIWQLLPQLFRHGRTLGTAVIWFALGMNLTVNTSLQLWLTKILMDSGFDQHTAIIGTEASFLAGIIGAFIIGPLMDRFGAYRVITGLFVAGGVFSVMLGISLSWTAAALIGASSFGSGFCTSGVQKGGNALCVYFYPTALRSTGLGWGLGIGRIGAIIGPLAVGYLLTAGWSPASVFTATAIPMVLGALAVTAMGWTYGETRAGSEPTAIARPAVAKG